MTVLKSDTRVLIIDDDPDLLQALGDQVGMYFEVELSSSVGAALARIEQAPAIDVALCDLTMPDGGADLWLKGCRRLGSTLAERTIILTGGPTTQRAAALVAAYQDRVLLKPFESHDLLALVQRLALAPRTDGGARSPDNGAHHDHITPAAPYGDRRRR